MPTLDILLVNRLSMHTCSIDLDSVPFSLLVTTMRNGPTHSKWKKLLWELPHTHVGGSTTGKYKLYSWHRISFYFPSSVRLLPALPAGNIHRVVDEHVSLGTVGTVPSINFEACEDLFPVTTPDIIFNVRCIYSSNKWQLRRLTLLELLRLKDYPDSLISALSIRHK